MLSDNKIIHNTSAIRTKFMLERMSPNSKDKRGRISPSELKKRKQQK